MSAPHSPRPYPVSVRNPLRSLRVWHYVPDIHLDERGLERYKRFSLGRHEAFVAKDRTISGNAPAASAVGKRPGNTVICRRELLLEIEVVCSMRQPD